MQKRHFLNAYQYTFAGISILTSLVSCSSPRITVAQIESPGGGQETLSEHAAIQSDAPGSAPEVNVTAAAQEMSIKDGRSILENNCAQCHLVQSFFEIKKSRADWEGALQQMEMIGIQISSAEKIILLDYLATTEMP